MAEELTGNCLVAQSGGPTAVVNSCLAGVVEEALNNGCIEEIYGSLNGMLGVLREELVDLAEESQQVIRGLRHTPGAALGSSRYKLHKRHDLDRVLQVFEAHDIRYFFLIGGNDSMETASAISEHAVEQGYELRVIGIPKTIDNDIGGTDHCPGYGSVAKHVATTVREIAADSASMGQKDVLTVIEVMGRNAGWIAAAASLAKRKDHPHDPPHLIYLPEVAFSNETFIDDVQRVLERDSHCLAIVSEGLVDEDGNYVTTTGSQMDAFGHAVLGGTGELLRNTAEEHLGIKARSIKLGSAQRAATHCASKTDSDEAHMAGEAAVTAAIEGTTGKMITLLRGDTDYYSCETGLADLAEVAGSIKTIPPAWINDDRVSMNFQFNKYALPLIQGEVQVPFENGLPRHVALGRHFVEKTLEPHVFE